MSSRHPVRHLVATLAALAAAVALGGSARADATACNATIIKAAARFVQANVKALEKCEVAKVRRKRPTSAVCVTDSRTAPLIAQARDKLSRSIVRACGGSDKRCGGADAADDDSPASIGWDIATCPGVESGACANPIASCSDIPTCLACVSEATVERAIGLYYGSLQPTDPRSKDKSVKALNKCQVAIGDFAAGVLAAKSKALATCWANVNATGSGSCPDGTTSAAVATVESKKKAALEKACRGPDKVVGTADDFTPADIGFPGACLDLMPPGGSACGGPVGSLRDLVDCVGCVTQFNVDCADRTAVPGLVAPDPARCSVVPPVPPVPPIPPKPECLAQRTVHLVSSNGGLAWFTLVWPIPEVITRYQATYAYDDPANAALVPGLAAGHPLYARKIAGRVLWDGIGAHGAASVFVAGTNETHNTPHTTTLGQTEIVAAGAALQSGFQSPVPVLLLGIASRAYGPAAGAPRNVAMVNNVDGAIGLFHTATSAELEQDLRPSPTTLATWIRPDTPTVLVELARTLLFTANAFRLGLISTVVMPAFNDDPHGAFGDVAGTVTPRADTLARILDGFYAELAGHVEPNCGHAGQPLSLADNVVLVVSGDTPKNSFQRAGWPDGTADGANLLYVRSNGYLKPGWFGALSASRRTDFDPITGAAASRPMSGASTAAAQLGLLFAIARGDAAAVARVSAAPYAGVIEATLP